MATINAKAFRVTDQSRDYLQCFIQEQIPEDTKFVLASPEGYLFLNEEPGVWDEDGKIRVPKMMIMSYYDVQFESE